MNDEVTVNLDFIQKITDFLMAPSNPSLFLTCVFLLFSPWTSGFVFLYLLFIYILSYLSLCLLSVNLVKSKLDPESLGIILLGPFLLEFFPDQVSVHVCASRWTLTSKVCTKYDKYLPPDTSVKCMDK